MHRNEYRRMAHEEVEEIFREILPQAGMKVREEQITLCHQMLSSLCGNKIALCDAAVGVGKTYAYLVACILFRKYSQLLSGYFSMCGQSQPIVISTSSIALQEAIQREYIPFLSQVLLKKGIISAPIQAVIRKGKEHFVCDNRLELRLDAVRRKAKNPLQREALYALREQYDMDSVQHLSGFDRRMVCVPKYCPETCEMRTYCRYQKYLKEAIDSILSQTYRNIELVVVNDCSTDKSLCIIKEYMEKDDRVKLVNNETNQKLPKSLNIGFEHCRGDYYTWTSDDNIMKPNAINRMLEVMKKEDADLVFSRCETINAEGKKIGESELYKNLDEIYYNNIVLASFLYKKEVHEKLHGYDTTKFLVEDYDFWLRAYQKFKFVYIREILYKIRFHGKNL